MSWTNLDPESRSCQPRSGSSPPEPLDQQLHRGSRRVIRSAWIPTRSQGPPSSFAGVMLALIADRVEGKPAFAKMRVGLRRDRGDPLREQSQPGARAGPPPGLTASPIPLGVPFRATRAGQESFQREGDDLVLRQPIEERRGWLPLLVTWDSGRNRKPLVWRQLTVSEGPQDLWGPRRPCDHRVAWGRDESLVIYRGLAPPARPRSFLGHKTAAPLPHRAVQQGRERRALVSVPS